jgi:putative transposase
MRQRTDSNRIEVLRQYNTLVQDGMTKGKAAKEVGVMPATIKKWERKYGNVPVEPAREIVAKSNGHDAELKQLRIENSRLKFIVADLSLDKQALMEAMGRK